MIAQPPNLLGRVKTTVILLYFAFIASPALGLQQKPVTDRLRSLDPNVLSEAAREEHAQKLASNVRRPIIAANHRSSEEWRQISNRAQWEQFAQQKVRLLES